MRKETSFFNPNIQVAQHDPIVQFIELLIKIDKREGIVRILNDEVIENETELAY
jgi:hypothetical protein